MDRGSNTFGKGPSKYDKSSPKFQKADRPTGKSAGLLLVEGHVKRHPDGFGFLIPSDPDFPDVYLPKHTMNGIMSNDVVKAKVTEESHDRYRGEINEVVKRAVSGLIGVYTAVTKDQGIILDKEGAWGSNVLIPPGKTKGAKDGELVHVKIQSYATWNSDLSGEVFETLGDSQDPLIDVKRVLITNQIPTEFSPETVRTAHDLPKEVLESEKKGRKDLRGIDLITIDGATAKDFDDAVCVVAEGGNFRLWVAIADVSHYVRPGTAIDKDAYTRGTSVYFPGYVVPMLPEQLSNELCSLKPKVDRLSLVCEAVINNQGDIVSSTFYEAVICSKSRVTYGEAQEVIDGAGDPKHAHVKQNILKCADLAKILLAKRFQRGSLDLEIPETQILIDPGGNPTDIVKSERLFAHKLIEELMLVANVCVAKFLHDAEIPAIYRIHEEPFEDSIEALNRFLTMFGANSKIEGGKLQKKINKALEAFHGKPQAEILSILTLRSMKQAKYSPTNVGHFGLGFDFYTHFTSPIRRYPDLIVHRLVKSLILKS
ncbi:MAG: VacB/RNase II family 3'-5' exoribonuclease, partial [Bdellovibrionales bacterium]|nr:VacB/RNase II family 3'-5' exoribonuclease [Bdellovibrionales bacterium]